MQQYCYGFGCECVIFPRRSAATTSEKCLFSLETVTAILSRRTRQRVVGKIPLMRLIAAKAEIIKIKNKTERVPARVLA